MMKKTNGTWSLHDGDKKVTEGNLAHVMNADYSRKNPKKKKAKKPKDESVDRPSRTHGGY